MENTVYLNQSLDNTSFTLVISNDQSPLTKASIAATLNEIAQQLTLGDNNEGRQQLILPGILPESPTNLLKFSGLSDIEPTQSGSNKDVPIFTEWYSKGNGAV